MSIFYCVVANSHCPLAEYSNGGDESMNEFAQKLLQKLNLAEDAVESMDFEGKTYSYRVNNELAYVCVTNEAFGKSSAALFLKHINQLFDNRFGIRGKATKLKLDMNPDFAFTLKKQMEMFSSDKGAEKMQALKNDLDNTEVALETMINTDLTWFLNCNEQTKYWNVVIKSNYLSTNRINSSTLHNSAHSSQSAAFAKSSTTLRRHLWWENVKMNIAIGALVVVCVALTVDVAVQAGITYYCLYIPVYQKQGIEIARYFDM
ncbi:hypothetical protein DD238_002586 [Peronospora effusa]|uniref:Longin domain-containing protein n=1 Tax=Peronospora effusa TaxID=542832 RepID=A0A3M6VDF9_9STRA|nr:hypothetical protein DD238_002586 [Peronospora effusa]RQM09275.1 hypothetical protein DD237_003536 [Peronospora effusa]